MNLRFGTTAMAPRFHDMARAVEHLAQLAATAGAAQSVTISRRSVEPEVALEREPSFPL